MYQLAHLALVVSDIDKSCEFYSRILGFTLKEKRANDDLNFVYLQKEGLCLELLQYRNDPCPDRTTGLFDHLAFYVDDIQLAINNFQKMGLTVLFDKPRELDGRLKINFIKGPDGEKIEIIEKVKN